MTLVLTPGLYAARSLGTILRQLRNAHGLSLEALEHKTDGQWKGVVVGSYERGYRKVTVVRAVELLDFYGRRLAILDPGDVVVPAVEGSERSHVEYLVVYGEELDGAIDCGDLAEASTIASYMPGSRVAYRTYAVGELTFVDGAL